MMQVDLDFLVGEVLETLETHDLTEKTVPGIERLVERFLKKLVKAYKENQ